MISVTGRIRQSLVGLNMARALEALDQIHGRLEKGEISAIEAIDELLAEELSLSENRRIGVAQRTARLMPIKTLESFDFSFQPSLDRHRIMALAELEFIRRAEVVHFLGPPGGVPPLKWSTNWDSIIPFQEDQRWLERETNPKRSC